jgi:hypothetical protein
MEGIVEAAVPFCYALPLCVISLVLAVFVGGSSVAVVFPVPRFRWGLGVVPPQLGGCGHVGRLCSA